MAQITQASRSPDAMSIGAPIYANQGPVELLPNPDFVFPQPTATVSDSTPIPGRRPQSLQPVGSSRRHSSHGRGKSTNLLPDFSFNPASEMATAPPTSTSPLPSLPTTPTTPAHPMGHRRGGSEFIGGDGKSGLGLMSASPTKSEAFLPPPITGLKAGPPTGRRGHAHRRSGAISSHDLSKIMNPNHSRNSTNGGSAPATPMDNEISSWQRPPINKHSSQPSLSSIPVDESSSSSGNPESSPKRPPSRARVGFSDRVEYIRPLSTISSETESSMSTVRGHSVSNSLSSIVSSSTGTPSPSGRRTRPTLSASPEPELGLARPKTAGAIMDLQLREFPFGARQEVQERPVSALVPSSPLSPMSVGVPSPGTPKRRHFFHLPSWHSENHEVLTSSSEPSLPAIDLETPPGSPVKESANELSDGEERSRAVPRKTSRKPRKVKSWANSIIKKSKVPSKSKVSVSDEDVPPVPAIPADLPSDLPGVVPDFDADNTVTLVTPTADVIVPSSQTDYVSWKPKHIVPENDARSPIIDLDLAFGPFEAENRWGSGARNQRRAMHSAGHLPSLQHRRTESAPALVPFEARTTMSSANVMADVFEEEEEEESEGSNPSGHGSNTTPATSNTNRPEKLTIDVEDEEVKGIGIQLVDSDMATGSAINWNFDDAARFHKRKEDLSPVPETPQSPFSGAPGPGQYTLKEAVEVVEDYEEPRTSSFTQSSDSTVTPTEVEVKDSQRPTTLSMPPPGQSLRTPDTLTNSSFSSIHFNRSQTSFDTPRLGTAASSITDSRTLGSTFGEPGPDLRMSNDDVPSLTSSLSTMTNGPQGQSLISPRIWADRASSVSSVHSANSETRRSKRSSIASLSRLMGVGGNFGERSKLHIEQRPQSEHMDLKVKESKAPKKPRRLSKMMQFWRSKDSRS